MADEIYIPTDRVPSHILQQLREIGLLVQNEPKTPQHPQPSSSPAREVENDDESDYLRSSAQDFSLVVPVLKSEVTSQEDAAPPLKRSDDVVSVFGSRSSPCKGVISGSADGQGGTPRARGLPPQQQQQQQQANSDVVSVFAPRSPVTSQEAPPSQNTRQTQQQQQLSPNKDAQNTKQTQPSWQSQSHFSSSPQSSSSMMQHIAQSQSQSQSQNQFSSSPQSSLLQQQQQQQHTSSFHSSSGQQQYSRSPYHDVLQDCRFSPSRSPTHRSASPDRQSSYSCHDADEELRRLHSRSPPKTPMKYSVHGAVNSESSSFAPASTLSSSPQSSSRSSLTPSMASSSFAHDEDVLLRGLSSSAGVVAPRPATPSADSAQRLLKMLTPPETPKDEGKRVGPEFFRFDEQYVQHFQDPSTPSKRAPSTPRKQASTPSTPSYRRSSEVPRSPSLLASRRLSPVDRGQHQQQQKEVPESPTASMQCPLQRLSMDDYPHGVRRDSLSPKPKKRLEFDDAATTTTAASTTVSSSSSQAQMLLHAQWLHQQQQQRNYDAGNNNGGTTSYSSHHHLLLPSPRPCGSGGGGVSSEMVFTYPAAPLEGQQQPLQYGGGGRHTGLSKTALAMAEFSDRMASLGRGGGGGGGVEEDEEEDRAASLIQSRVLQQQQSGRYGTKRRRQEPEVDGNDDMVCACAVMERNFLQMAECAYKRIRRLDTTPADFDRFRTELTQTNQILRESMGLMKYMRDICDHGKRPRW